MLYIPFRTSEASLLTRHTSWALAFDTHKVQIARTERKFTAPIDNEWGDIDEVATEAIENIDLTKDFDIDHAHTKMNTEIKKYDIMSDIKHIKASQNMHVSRCSLFSEIPHPFILPNEEYFSL